MLDQKTKKRIDNCRDILVGKITDPKSQVEQITIALIYKFMDDMDIEAVEDGGVPTFFIGEFERYSWTNIFNPRMGGHEVLNLYGEGMSKMNENPNLPQLFRDIFKNAYLPYRDPETLKLFLKEINNFNYTHSEKLGDAFEYLLSVLGSQGDAGQFRTPRHIIDFIVEILDPKINETILDPSCGTAGFLISGYKHILKSNTHKNLGDKITPYDKKRLIENVVGYDISPDMIRLSLVNLFLHGFTDPKIYEYDTLTSEDKWNEYYDVILANPPFMSPKGGIRPHKKFSIQSNRSEVLFVDYIMEHLTPKGRAGIIVPDGVIFKSGNAYKSLRKLLVEKYLVGIVSLPGGVFQPYSGVKTSILILDRELSSKTDQIFFVKIDNDGFDLGSQRKEIETNDLPSVKDSIKKYINNIKIGFEDRNDLVIIKKDKVIKSNDFSLNVNKYIKSLSLESDYEIVKLSDILEIERGGSPRPIQDYITTNSDGVNWIKIGDATNSSKYIYSTKEKIKPEGIKKSRIVKEGDFILSNSMSFGKPYIMKTSGCIHDGWLLLRPKGENINTEFLYYLLSSENIYREFTKQAVGGVVNNLNIQLVKEVEVPLPPIEIQEKIVYQIEQMNIENNKLKLKIDTNNREIQERINEIWGVKEPK